MGEPLSIWKIMGLAITIGLLIADALYILFFKRDYLLEAYIEALEKEKEENEAVQIRTEQ